MLLLLGILLLMIGQNLLESPLRMEPALIEDGIPTKLLDLAADIGSTSTRLERLLHPATAAGLASMVHIMNCYYSNLIEGHNTRPKDIEAALQFAAPLPTDIPSTSQIESNVLRIGPEKGRLRNLLIEARAHVHVQAKIDVSYLSGAEAEPTSVSYIKWLHKEFYADATPSMLTVRDDHGEMHFVPGEWRSRTEHDVAIGRHVPPTSAMVADFMTHFEKRYSMKGIGKGAAILAIPAAHHRFNFIHPFPDGNGRVSRLMSHAMGHAAGIGAHGLWSVSRGLARGI